MPADDSFDNAEDKLRALERIACLLDRPVEDFFRSDQSLRADTAELLRLWLSIGHTAGRRRVLECAQDAAATSRH